MTERLTHSETDVYAKSEADRLKRFRLLRKAASVALAGVKTRELRRGKRLKELHNMSANLPAWGDVEKPDPQAMEAVKLESPNVDYLSLTDNSDYVAASDQMYQSASTVLESNYQKALRVHLSQKIKQDFPGMKVGVRTIQTSINGSIRKGDTMVMDVADVARFGKEHEHDSDVIRLAPLDESGNVTSGFTGQFAEENTKFREKMRKTGRADEIFPAVIIYDMDQLERTATNYAHSYTGDASRAVLSVCVLDAPRTSSRTKDIASSSEVDWRTAPATHIDQGTYDSQRF